MSGGRRITLNIKKLLLKCKQHSRRRIGLLIKDNIWCVCVYGRLLCCYVYVCQYKEYGITKLDYYNFLYMRSQNGHSKQIAHVITVAIG